MPAWAGRHPPTTNPEFPPFVVRNVPLLKSLGRVTTRDTVFRYVLQHDTARLNNRPFSNRHRADDNYPGSEPNVVLDDDVVCNTSIRVVGYGPAVVIIVILRDNQAAGAAVKIAADRNRSGAGNLQAIEVNIAFEHGVFCDPASKRHPQGRRVSAAADLNLKGIKVAQHFAGKNPSRLQAMS